MNDLNLGSHILEEWILPPNFKARIHVRFIAGSDICKLIIKCGDTLIIIKILFFGQNINGLSLKFFYFQYKKKDICFFIKINN